MAITAYAFPVLYDLSFVGFALSPKTDQHGVFIIEFEGAGEHGVRGFLFNKNHNLRGYTPLILDPEDYNANSWAICDTRLSRAGLEYNQGHIRVQVKPLPLNSGMGKVIRREYRDIPLKTIKDLPL